MCGIAGLISREPIRGTELYRLKAAGRALLHRGPDGEGDYTASHVALTMRRLSIIDLAHGWQPIFNEDRSLVVIANGEIYNFIELRAQLEAKGHRFSTGSDCETVLHLYEEHGLDCVQRLRGMYAFALWDEKRRRLLVARDRMGEKPLYIYEQEGRLIFASELKALLGSGLIPFELDAEAVNLYFHYQYVPEPLTPIKGVRKLDAGHFLTVDVDSWRVEERCYWRMEDAPPLEGDPAELIQEQLETVSELVIRSDVPVGVALSGGLDSSAIAALAVSKYPGTMHAFSVGYPGQAASDERSDARALANHLGMPFHDIELETEAMVDFFPALNYWRDDPIADISGYGYYAVSKLAREHSVPVMLQGQGGDELFWGYDWVRQAALETMQKGELEERRLGAWPGYLAPHLPKKLNRPELSQWVRSLGGVRAGWRRLQAHTRAPSSQMVFYDRSADFRLATEETRSLYPKAFTEQLHESNVARLFTLPKPWPSVDVTLTRLICNTYLRENGIAQGDRLSMASSVELRLPLVDYRLVETVVGLRKVHTDVNLQPKAWFRAALRNLLPDWVLNRPKRGFAPPVREWHNAIFAKHGSSLCDGYLVGAGVITKESGCHLAQGPFPPSAITPLSFKALVLEQWCRQMSSLYLERETSLGTA